jgi:hypothetical protein
MMRGRVEPSVVPIMVKVVRQIIIILHMTSP